MKKTKIVCTLGPASETQEVISAMADAGMNVVRLNFSHGTHEDHAKKIEIIRRVREEKNIPLPILLDTKGPEFRIRTFKNGKVTLNEGDTFTFTTEEIEGRRDARCRFLQGHLRRPLPGRQNSAQQRAHGL